MAKPIAENSPLVRSPVRLIPHPERDWFICQAFWPVNMNMQHDGLSAVAENSGIDVEKLKPGQFVLFLNYRQTRVKLYTAGGLILYLRVKGGRISAETIEGIPYILGHKAKVSVLHALKKLLIETRS